MQPCDFRLCDTKNGRRSVGAHSWVEATSVSCAFSAITPTNTFTMGGCENGTLSLSNV